MKSPIRIKEESSIIPPATSVVVVGTVETQQPLKKGPWTAAEDAILIEYVKKYGEGNWNAVQKNIGLQRCGKSCRLRWANHLRPNLKKGSFSPEEEELILQLHAQLGNKWARMAAQLPGRTDNEIKNYWNTRIKRRQRAGLPLYPPEIQRQVAFMNQRQGTFKFLQHQNRPKNFISHISPTTTTLFNHTGTSAGNTNYLLGNFNNPQHQQHQSSPFSIKMELPSNQNQLFHGYADDQKLQSFPTPPVMGQGNNVLFDDPFQESQGPGELFNEGLFFEHLSTSCITTAEHSSPPPPQSNSKHSIMDPLYLCSSFTDRSSPTTHAEASLSTSLQPTSKPLPRQPSLFSFISTKGEARRAKPDLYRRRAPYTTVWSDSSFPASTHIPILQLRQ